VAAFRAKALSIGRITPIEGVLSVTLPAQDLSALIECQGNYFAAGVALERDLST
jgi:hypothetical protein